MKWHCKNHAKIIKLLQVGRSKSGNLANSALTNNLKKQIEGTGVYK